MVKKKMQISVKIFLVSARALYITAVREVSVFCQGRGGRHRACRRGVQKFQKICFRAEHSDWRLTGVSPSRRHTRRCVILDPLYSNFRLLRSLFVNFHRFGLYSLVRLSYIADAGQTKTAKQVASSSRAFVGRVAGRYARKSFMSGNHRNGTPAYKRIQDSIRKRIQADKLTPGDAVASERELARAHKVSLMTARHALAGLEREGIVERRRGAGTFVASPKIHFNKLMSYTEHMSSRGLAPRSRVLVANVIEDEQEVAARLGLPAASRMVKIERLRLTGEESFALETCYLPIEFDGLVRAPWTRNSLFAALEHDYGVELAYADEEVDATAADIHIADLLGLPKGAPLLRIRQVIYSTKGKATIYVVGFYRSERHTLFIRRYR